MRGDTITDGFLKALLSQGVEALGGQEAAAVYLGVSRQRIGQLCSHNSADMPTLRQVIALEVALERPVVTGAIARAIAGDQAPPIMDKVVEAVGGAASVLTLVRDMDADGARGAGEIRQVQRAAQTLLREAEAIADGAAALKPGRVG